MQKCSKQQTPISSSCLNVHKSHAHINRNNWVTNSTLCNFRVCVCVCELMCMPAVFFCIFICTSYFGSIVVIFFFYFGFMFYVFYVLCCIFFLYVSREYEKLQQTNKREKKRRVQFFFIFIYAFMLDAQNCTCCGAIAIQNSGWVVFFLFSA